MLIPLNKIIQLLKEDNELLQKFLSSFFCEQDHDIETFLHERAVNFERLSKARTYLVCDAKELQENTLENVTIYGYISLALKTLYIPQSLSNRMRKELDGFSAKIHGEQIHDIPCYLIGQLGRNSQVSKENLSGGELLQFAYDIIEASVQSVGGRYIMIECKEDKKLVYFYKSHDFSEITRIPDGNCPMVQMIRKI